MPPLATCSVQQHPSGLAWPGLATALCRNEHFPSSECQVDGVDCPHWSEKLPSPPVLGALEVGTSPVATGNLPPQAPLCHRKPCLRQNARCQTEPVHHHQVSRGDGKGVPRARLGVARQWVRVPSVPVWDGLLPTSSGRWWDKAVKVKPEPPPLPSQRGEWLWQNGSHETHPALPGCHEPETGRHAAGTSFGVGLSLKTLPWLPSLPRRACQSGGHRARGAVPSHATCSWILWQ